MGMFDYIHCEYPLPGITDPTKIEFQTKSTENQFLDNFRITAEGRLEIEDYDVEDQSDPNAEGFLRMVGMCTRIPKGWNPVDFSGILNFYGDVNSGNLFLVSFEDEGSVSMLDENGDTIPCPKTEWFEYDAIFDKGNLFSVARVEREQVRDFVPTEEQVIRMSGYVDNNGSPCNVRQILNYICEWMRLTHSKV